MSPIWISPEHNVKCISDCSSGTGGISLPEAARFCPSPRQHTPVGVSAWGVLGPYARPLACSTQLENETRPRDKHLPSVSDESLQGEKRHSKQLGVVVVPQMHLFQASFLMLHLQPFFHNHEVVIQILEIIDGEEHVGDMHAPACTLHDGRAQTNLRQSKRSRKEKSLD